jgi:DNA-directed RNA polymerase subunit K/omega
MRVPSLAPHPLLNDGVNATTLGSRFLLSAIAFLRSKQLIAGSTPRIERNGHKATYIAVLEVAADTISWTRD